MTDLPDWITVGAMVGVRNSTFGYRSTISVRAVERLTATQIVVDGGARFRRSDLRRVGEGSGELLPLTDPMVVQGRVDKRVENVRRAIDNKVETYHRTNGTPQAAVALLDEIAELVAKARAGIVAVAEGRA